MAALCINIIHIYFFKYINNMYLQLNFVKVSNIVEKHFESLVPQYFNLNQILKNLYVFVKRVCICTLLEQCCISLDLNRFATTAPDYEGIGARNMRPSHVEHFGTYIIFMYVKSICRIHTSRHKYIQSPSEPLASVA